MMPLSSMLVNAVCRLNEIVHRIPFLPMLIFYPTSRCNSRCISCDWWRRNGGDDMSMDEVAALADSLSSLGTRSVVMSGGEPLLRPELFEMARLFGRRNRDLWLLSSGLLLEEQAECVAQAFDRAVVSLDASTPALYRQIRGIDGLERVEAGVRKLKALAPYFPITARATLHRANFRELPALIDAARSTGFDGISFLAADVSSTAFGRGEVLGSGPRERLALHRREIVEFESVISRTARSYAEAFESGFVLESVEKLRRLPHYYAALLGEADFPRVACSVPWISVVVEADGAVRPCYFHPPVGSVRERPLAEILRDEVRAFRQQLDVSQNPICRRCTCSLKISLLSDVW